MAKKFKKSFYDWCMENNHEDYLELWDYELNGCRPKNIAYRTDKKYYFKCVRGIHKSESRSIHSLTKDDKRRVILKCEQCNSFGQWCVDNNHKNWLDLWDYELNEYSPFEISHGSTKKFWFKCPKGIHKSMLKSVNNITNNKNYKLRCIGCNSIGQHLIDTFGEDALEKYWDYNKNEVDPFEILKSCDKKVWLFCQEKDYHPSYDVRCANFTRCDSRCPYCANQKIHPKDSFAQYHIDNTDPDFLNKYWSKRNTIDPFTIAPNSKEKCWFICQNDEEHENYKAKCGDFTNNRRCPICKESKGERAIREILNTYNINFISQKTFPNLLGIGNGNLSYDFYLPDYNLLIEYQGNYHDGTVLNQTQERFEYQQEHDRRKREYAESHNIQLLEIWYWDYDNIEEILNKNIK